MHLHTIDLNLRKTISWDPKEARLPLRPCSSHFLWAFCQVILLASPVKAFKHLFEVVSSSQPVLQAKSKCKLNKKWTSRLYPSFYIDTRSPSSHFRSRPPSHRDCCPPSWAGASLCWCLWPEWCHFSKLTSQCNPPRSQGCQKRLFSEADPRGTLLQAKHPQNQWDLEWIIVILSSSGSSPTSWLTSYGLIDHSPPDNFFWAENC